MDCLVNSSSFLDNVLWVAPVNKQDGRRGPETQKLPKRYCFWGKISQLSTFNTRWTGEINTSSIYFVYTYLLFSTSFGFGFCFGFAKTLRFRFRFHRNPKNGFCWPLFSSIVWCNLNWLLMDVTSLKVPLVLLSSSLHPNHQSREEQRAKRGAHARLSRSKTLEPLPQFFFLVRKKTWATVATAPSRAEKLYKMSWPH